MPGGMGGMSFRIMGMRFSMGTTGLRVTTWLPRLTNITMQTAMVIRLATAKPIKIFTIGSGRNTVSWLIF